MNILCINTAFAKAQVALSTKNSTDFCELESNAKNSEKVLPEIEKILIKNNVKLKDLDYISVVVGTGSFTGVRISVALVKGFSVCFPKIKLVAINSLDLMAFEWLQKHNEKNDFYCIQNALSGRFFLAKYSKSGKNIGGHKLVNELPDKKIIGLENDNLTKNLISFTAKNLLKFTIYNINQSNFTNTNNLAPIYLRLSQAEENLLKKESKNNES